MVRSVWRRVWEGLCGGEYRKVCVEEERVSLSFTQLLWSLGQGPRNKGTKGGSKEEGKEGRTRGIKYGCWKKERKIRRKERCNEEKRKGNKEERRKESKEEMKNQGEK